MCFKCANANVFCYQASYAAAATYTAAAARAAYAGAAAAAQPAGVASFVPG